MVFRKMDQRGWQSSASGSCLASKIIIYKTSEFCSVNIGRRFNARNGFIPNGKRQALRRASGMVLTANAQNRRTKKARTRRASLETI